MIELRPIGIKLSQLLPVSLVLIGCMLASAIAQVNTIITGDGTLGTSVTSNAGSHDIIGGTRPGNGSNLFHSLSQFSVGEGDIANFLNDSGLATENILNRVTGGDASDIFGTIQTTGFGAANLFLFNPAGVVFGPTASLNVAGSFYVSTADFISLGTDGIFYADLDTQSILTSAPPAAFGFLGGNPASISFNGSNLEVSIGETISVIGGDINVTGGTITAPTGQITFASLRSSGEVTFNSESTVVVNAAQLGTSSLSDDAWINTDGEVGGTVFIRSGTLVMDSAKISSDTTGTPGNTPAGMSSTPGEIHIETNGDMLMDNLSLIQADVLSGSQKGAKINIEVGGDLVMRGGVFNPNLVFDGISGIRAFASGGSGNTGDIEVQASDVLIEGDVIGILGLGKSASTGDLGNIRVTSNNVRIEGAAVIGGIIASSNQGTGGSGSIEVTTTGGEVFVDLGNILSFVLGSGNAGDVIIDSDSLNLANTAVIQSGTGGPGNAGSVSLQLTGDLDIREGAFIGTLVDVSCISSSCGSAGDTTITARDIVITGIENADNPLVSPNFTGIRTRSVAEVGGNVIVNADNLQITDNGVIRSSSLGPERAGDISVTLDGNFELSNKGQLLATAAGTGDGGNINVSATNVSLSNKAAVTAQSSSLANQAGDAGNISLEGRDIVQIGDSTISTSAEKALGGNITLKAENLIQITNSQITSDVDQGSANAGSINIDPEFIVIQNSLINTSANIGNGGDVTMIASSAILIDPFSTIDTSSQFGGSGTVDIRAPIQNLGETIAQLPEEILKVSGLFAARCAAQKDGKFSSFLRGSHGTPPGVTGFLSSPLSFSSLASESPTTTTSRLGIINDRQNDASWKRLNTTLPIDLTQGCSSISHSRS